MIRTFYLMLLSSRIATSLIASFVVFVMIYNNENDIYVSFIHSLIFMLVTMYGFVINDIIDYKKDKLAKRNRPISNGDLTKKNASYFSLSLILISLTLEYYLGNSISLRIIIYIILLLTLYSFISKYLPLIKGLVTSLLCLTPIIYVNSLIEIYTNTIIYTIIFVFIFGRELFMDAQDLKGDIISNLKTIPYYLGIEKSKIAGFIIMLVSLFSYFVYSMIILNIINVIFSFISLSSCLYAFKISLSNEEKAIKITKSTMILAIVSMFYSFG